MTTPPLRLAMLGMVDGNGHPWSWSAIFNGFDAKKMSTCPYPVIPQYLGKQPADSFPLPGARVTHIWTDDPSDAEAIAPATFIPTIVKDPCEVIGKVDAVIVATDKGHEHVERCREFVEAGLPIFVDKPLTNNPGDLNIFRDWIRDGARIVSTSCMRYAREFTPYHLGQASELGELRFAGMTICKSWERYGIHALEALYPIFGPGFTSVRNTGSAERNVVHLTHRNGADAVIIATHDMFGGFGCLQLCGTCGQVQTQFQDTFHAFRSQLEAFVHYLHSGIAPLPFSETDELMQLIIAGIQSREQGGRLLKLPQAKDPS